MRVRVRCGAVRVRVVVGCGRGNRSSVPSAHDGTASPFLAVDPPLKIISSYLYRMIYFIMILIIIVLILWQTSRPPHPPLQENYADQTVIDRPDPAPLSWDFTSPKSGIQNFNETTELHQNRNIVKESNSSMIDHYQPFPDWVYPYTYINRKFDQILRTIVHKIEKDYNNGQRLIERNNAEWKQPYPYQTADLPQLDQEIQGYIDDIMAEINRRFNLEVPIVGFREQGIQFHWVSEQEIIIKLRVFKRYTFEDIKYEVDIDPNINEHLKSNFEVELLINIDGIDHDGRYHIKFLRFPVLDYEKDDTFDEFHYAGEYDNRFYIAKSKDPFYRMISNVEARNMYIQKITQDKDRAKYQCFPSKTTTRESSGATRNHISDQTGCELSNGIWEKRCEKDTDCPYYRANQNYPNEFGGCDVTTGYCRGPVGVKDLTFKKPENPDQAYCYNCPKGFLGPKTLGQCCPQQKKPDYMFIKDVSQRYNNQQILEQEGLAWSKY
jgi:hypothetical protein